VGVGVGTGVGGGVVTLTQAVPLFVNPVLQVTQVDVVGPVQVTFLQFVTAVQFVQVPLLLYW
jgi:hypothetical protein